MTDPTSKDPHPGMLGDGTEEQNLNQSGDPSKRITEDEVDAAFGGEDDPEQPDPDDSPEPVGDPDGQEGQVGDPVTDTPTKL